MKKSLITIIALVVFLTVQMVAFGGEEDVVRPFITQTEECEMFER